MPNHASTLFRSSRLSNVFSSRFSEVFEKVENRRSIELRGPSDPTLPNSLSSQERSPVAGLQHELDLAILAESPTEPYLFLENEYPALRSLRTDRDIGDGLWICCYCRHENILRHWRGAHPFKYLKCDRCNRKLSSNCHTSEILMPWAHGLIYARPPASGQEVRYCHVCTKCGLSHRAEMEGTTLDFYGATCAGCGASSWSSDWPHYHIGNAEPYRRDPVATFASLMDARAKDAAKLVHLRSMAETDVLTVLALESTSSD